MYMLDAYSVHCITKSVVIMFCFVLLIECYIVFMLRLSFVRCYLDVVLYLYLCRSVLCFSSINLSNVSNLSWNKMLTLQFLFAFVRKGSVYDKLTLVWILGMRRTGDKPIPKSVMVLVPGCICARSQWPVTGGPIYKHGLNLILARISNLIPGKSRGEITYTFPNFNGVMDK